MHFFITILVLMTTMGIKDVLGTSMVIFEANGNGRLAGAMDASSDIINFIYTVVGVDALNKAGFSLDSALLLLALAFTSYNVTKYTTIHLTKRGMKKIAKHGLIEEVKLKDEK